MGVNYSTLLIADGTDLEAINKQNIRAGFLLDLPFRLRVGELRRFSFDLEGPTGTTELCIRNQVNIPAGTDLNQVIVGLFPSGGFRRAFSQALIILDRPQIKDEELKAIQDASRQPDIHHGGLTSNAFHALKSLNAFLVAYHSATGQLFGGKHLHKLSDMHFFDNLRWQLTILCPEDHHFQDEELLEIFDLKPEKEIRECDQFTGELDDLLPEVTISRLGDSISHYADYLFYEMAFEAKVRMIERDFIGALLLSVVALEGAHAAFLRSSLTQKLPTDNADQLIANMLRDAGLYNLYQVTPFILMDDQERPSIAQLEACGRGITMRNEFMHSLLKRGEYKIRNRTPSDISNAYSSVFQVYQSYVSALERRLGGQEGLASTEDAIPVGGADGS